MTARLRPRHGVVLTAVFAAAAAILVNLAGQARADSVPTVVAWRANGAGQYDWTPAGQMSTLPIPGGLPPGTTVTSIAAGCESPLAFLL
jgi:hypothetical protein